MKRQPTKEQLLQRQVDRLRSALGGLLGLMRNEYITDWPIFTEAKDAYRDTAPEEKADGHLRRRHPRSRRTVAR